MIASHLLGPDYGAALTAANVPNESYIYAGSVHGFNCDATPERYNKAASSPGQWIKSPQVLHRTKLY
jgi:dienelactone hydrolase